MAAFIGSLRSLSIKSQHLICSFLGKQEESISWVSDYVELAKQTLNQQSFLSGTINESMKKTPKKKRKKSSSVRIQKSKPSSLSVQKKESSCLIIQKEKSDNSIKVLSESDGVVPVLTLSTPLSENREEKNSDDEFITPVSSPVKKPIESIKKTPVQEKRNSPPKSARPIQNKQSSQQRVLAVTKASRHRSSFNKSVLLSSCQKSTNKAAALRSTNNKQEYEEAIAKKQALLKMKVEEQKRKREIKMEKNLQARLQMEREAEERLKKNGAYKEERIAAAKEAEKLKKEAKNKRRKQEDSSDAEKQGNMTVKVAKVNPTTPALTSATKSAVPTTNVTPAELCNSQEKAGNQKILNATYVAENKENSESYALTPKPRQSSYTNYDMSELRPSDDEDDDDEPKKPIPSWATGIRLKEALIKQFFNPPNIDDIFPATYLLEEETFGMIRKRKIQRSSSAVWNTPMRPLPSQY